ncbi:single-stranded-DNA-specific exonuclease RecJ [bacterium]|nr:single-stranded-DNA-specific exonuclease RecJ [bacterium]
MKSNWKIKEGNKNFNVVENILFSRGIKEEDFSDFLTYSNAQIEGLKYFQDMERAVSRIKCVIENKEKILIWGDFDCDGVTSSVIMSKCLDALGANYLHFIPHRIKNGHGLDLSVLIPYITREKIKLLITFDCGISDAKIIQTLKSMKIDTIITDHHAQNEKVESAYAVIDANAKDSLRPDLPVKDIGEISMLSGAGVAYLLSLELLRGEAQTELEKELLVLATIGTIGDIVPLLGLNRQIVKAGLKEINNGNYPVIEKIFALARVEGQITSEMIAFTLVPRINASGRLSDASEAYLALYTNNEFTMAENIEKLNNLNAIRQALSDEIYAECCTKIQNQNSPMIFLEDKSWHIGIIGLVASRLVEKYQKPVFIATYDENNIGRCSIRGVEPFSISTILADNKELFITSGGHKFAGGFSFDPENYSFSQIAAKLNSDVDEINKNFKPEVLIDLELSASEINLELIEKLSLLEPFGEANEPPCFLLKDAILKNFKQIGKEGKHLRLTFEQNGYFIPCVWWNKPSFKGLEGEVADVIFTLKENEFNGEKNIQAEIIDIDMPSLEKANVLKTFDYRKKEDIYDTLNTFFAKNSDIKIYAKKFATIKKLENYENLKNAILACGEKAEKIMFFDYPSDCCSINLIIENAEANVAYFMKEEFSSNLETYIFDIFKMLKFAQRKKEGIFEISKMAQGLGVTDDFVQFAIDILQDKNIIEILENKVLNLQEDAFELVPDEITENIIEEFEFIKRAKQFVNSSPIEILLDT